MAASFSRLTARSRVRLARATVLAASLLAAATSPAADDPLVARALAIHERVLTLDTHVDILDPKYATPALDPGAPSTNLKCDLTKMEKGQLDGVFLAVFVAQGPLDAPGYARAWERALAKFQAIQRLTGQMHTQRSVFAATPAEVERAATTGRRIIMTGVENGYPLGTELAKVRRVYELGARYITLTHSGNNQLGDSSSAQEPLHGGLSPFGREVVAEMNRLGLMVDVSHIAEKSFWDVLAITRAPIIASHSGCKAVCDHDRNLTDEQLKALARNGGVMQTVALRSYLKEDSPERRAALIKLRAELGLPAFGGRRGRAPGAAGGAPAAARNAPPDPAAPPAQPPAASSTDSAEKLARYRERMKEIDAQFPGASLTDFIDHIDHAVRVAGIDHVGIGTDFDGGGGIPGFNDHSEAPNVTIELVRRGYTEEQIRKIWGGNLLRVWCEVERVAARLQKEK